MREPLSRIFLAAESPALGRLENLKATVEAVGLVMHGRFGELEGEPARVIAARYTAARALPSMASASSVRPATTKL